MLRRECSDISRAEIKLTSCVLGRQQWHVVCSASWYQPSHTATVSWRAASTTQKGCDAHLDISYQITLYCDFTQTSNYNYLTWLDLIHPMSTWTYWATLWRHSCLLRAATSASSQVSPIPRRSFLTIPLQFVLGRPGPLLKPGTSQYSAWCVMRRWSIRIVWPSQHSLLPLRVFRMLCWPVLALTSSFVTTVTLLQNNQQI